MKNIIIILWMLLFLTSCYSNTKDVKIDNDIKWEIFPINLDDSREEVEELIWIWKAQYDNDVIYYKEIWSTIYYTKNQVKRIFIEWVPELFETTWYQWNVIKWININTTYEEAIKILWNDFKKSLDQDNQKIRIWNIYDYYMKIVFEADTIINIDILTELLDN